MFEHVYIRRHGSQPSMGLTMLINGQLISSFTKPRPRNGVNERFFILPTQQCANALERAKSYEAEKSNSLVISVPIASTEILVDISNQGPDIPAEVCPYVFEAFHQVENTSARQTGLGPAICIGLVESYGGRI